MAVNEASLRSELSRDFQKEGAFVQTITQRFLAGTPDLLVCFEGGVWFLELKFVSKAYRGSDEPMDLPAINLSSLQRAWMRRFQKAGGLAGWVVGEPSPKGTRLYAGTLHLQERVTKQDFVMVKERGEPWSIRALFDILEASMGPIRFERRSI